MLNQFEVSTVHSYVTAQKGLQSNTATSRNSLTQPYEDGNRSRRSSKGRLSGHAEDEKWMHNTSGRFGQDNRTGSLNSQGMQANQEAQQKEIWVEDVNDYQM